METIWDVDTTIYFSNDVEAMDERFRIIVPESVLDLNNYMEDELTDEIDDFLREEATNIAYDNYENVDEVYIDDVNWVGTDKTPPKINKTGVSKIAW